MVDLMSELSNILMGAVKAEMGDDGLAFTGGLPEELSAEQVLASPAKYGAQTAFTLQSGESLLTIHVGVRSKGNIQLESDDLAEGMVLAKDLFNEQGLLLANGGTRLSTSMVKRLRGLIPHAKSVEIMG